MRWRDVSFFTALERSQKYENFDLQPQRRTAKWLKQQATLANGPFPKTPGLPSRVAVPAAELVAIGAGSKQ